jgi:hypothetical protein
LRREINVFFFGDTRPVSFNNVDTLNYDPASKSWMIKYTTGTEDTIISRENIKFIHSTIHLPPVEEAEVVEDDG